MIRKGKKPVSLAYKEKLLANIAYYEKRIEEALHKKKHNLRYFEDVVSTDEGSNPYKVNVGPFPMQLKREEARLSARVSMTLELAMLTIMQSEVNIMAEAPEVRRPVSEDGTWLEVAAECKIDLVSFTITFYAHKPHRKFAPTRFRSLQVNLTKAAHEKELSQSVLVKLNRPNLALQVLQSYATAFRSRRTTLLELAEKYGGSLNMEALPEGGYRVKFLDLLTVDWTLENMWSPIVPFCHRMKFEVEYMPKHYIHAIGKLYKQFKDPSLETSTRTHVLSKIFDICLEAQGPARDLQDTFESDPETAGRLHERRTTIDQELEVPSKCDQNVPLSPQKLPKGKEHKAHNRKTTMAPPKTIPKKAKKVANVNNKANEVVDDENVSKSSKSNEKVPSDDATKTHNDNSATESRKAVKRAIENDVIDNAEKIGTDEKTGAKSSGKVTLPKKAKKVANVNNKANEVVDDENVSKSSKSNEKVPSDDATKTYNDNSATEVRKAVKRAIENDAIGNAEKIGTDEKTGAKSSEKVTLPKKAKKVANVNNKAKDVVNDDNVSKSSKPNEKVLSDAATKTYNDNSATESRKAVKRAIENEAIGNAKKIRTDETTGAKSSEKVSDNDNEEANGMPNVSSKSNTRKKDSKAISKNMGDIGTDVNPKSKKNTDASKSGDSKDLNKRAEASSKNATEKLGGHKNNTKLKEIETDVADPKNEAKKVRDASSVATSKTSVRKTDANGGNHVATAKEQSTEGNVASSKNNKRGVDGKSVVNSKTDSEKDNVTGNSSNDLNKKVSNNKNQAPSKNLIDTMSSASSKNTNKVERESNKHEKTKLTEVVEKNKADNIKKVQKDNVKDKVSKASTKDKETVQKKTVDNNQVAKQNEAHEITEKSVKSKQNNDKASKSSDKNKESLGDVVKNKVTSKKNTENKSNQNAVENNTQKINENKESFVQKFTKPNSEATKNMKNDVNSKKATTVVEKSNTIVSKVSNATNKVKNKMVAKESTNSIKNQNKDKAETLRNVNTKTVLGITKPDTLKSNIQTENPNLRKMKENQMKIADKLKTRIPMMKNKLKIGTFNDNLGKTEGKYGKNAEKTKIPLKSLPVFKKIVRNVPTRMSPRKLPSTFKPSSHGYSNK